MSDLISQRQVVRCAGLFPFFETTRSCFFGGFGGTHTRFAATVCFCLFAIPFID
jgi:hypothetical protein